MRLRVDILPWSLQGSINKMTLALLVEMHLLLYVKCACHSADFHENHACWKIFCYEISTEYQENVANN